LGEFHAQTRLRTHVMIQLGGCSVLPDGQVETAVAVIISHGRAALFPVNLQSGLLSGNRLKSTLPITPQQKAAPAVVARRPGLNGEKILSQYQVLVAVTVEIADTNTERRRKLRFDGQDVRFEMIASI